MGISGWIGVGTLLAVVALGAFATIRDKVLEVGLDRPRWLMRPLERSSHRSAARRITRDVALLGSEFFEHTGNATDVAVDRKRLPKATRERPDQQLLAALKGWTLELTGTVDFHGLRHYANTMGAVSSSEDKAAEFATIAHGWLAALQSMNLIVPYDCVFGIKDGNPILVHSLAQRLRRSEERPVRPVFCKGQQDSAKVSRGLHETDFEGLRAFRDDQPIPRGSDGRYRAIAIDDNCTTGRSLSSAVSRFNRFVADNQQEYPFAPIDTAVVLFVVKTKETNAFAESEEVALHALLALGDDEMHEIHSKPIRKLTGVVSDFKDSPACRWSRTLDGETP